MDELRLDGNAAAGALQEVFSFEVTTAEYACRGCGRAGRLGEAMVYEARGLGHHRPLPQLRQRPYPARPRPRTALGRPRRNAVPDARLVPTGSWQDRSGRGRRLRDQCATAVMVFGVRRKTGTPPARELTATVLQPGRYGTVRDGTGGAERAGFRAWVSHLAIRDGTQRDGGLAIGNRVGGVKPSRGFESPLSAFFRFRVLGFRCRVGPEHVLALACQRSC